MYRTVEALPRIGTRLVLENLNTNEYIRDKRVSLNGELFPTIYIHNHKK